MQQRSIKFRAWDTVEKEWYDFESGALEFKDITQPRCTVAYFDLHDDLVLMQSTGLKDKNGKEIWEGDVVLIPDSYTVPITDEGQGPEEPHNHLAEVKFGNGEFVFVVTDKADVLRPGTYTWNALCDETGVDDLEVIGNRFENPELLK